MCPFKLSSVFKILLGTVITLSLSTTSAVATTIYVYHQRDGSVLVTDHRMLKKGNRLIRRYQTAHSQTARRMTKYGKRTDSTMAKSTPGPRVSSFDDQIDNYAQLNRLDPALLKAVVQVESGFDPMATSKTGALGLMQLMPDTARRYGVTNSYDPEQNLAAGARYLRELLTSFGENINLTLAAYNAGFENVRRFRGIPPFAETLRYIRKVTSLLSLYREQG